MKMAQKCLFVTISLIFFIVQLIKINAQEPPKDIQSRILTEDEGCGIPKGNSSGFKIIGGEGAEEGEFPWMALLGYVNNWNQESWKCGGSLITSKHVLTAAHCVSGSLRKVRLGEHNIESDDDGSVQDIDVIRAEKHPEHNKNKDGTNDIAILHLRNHARFSNRVRPICLPTSDPIRSRSFIGENTSIAGWGLDENGGSFNVLQKLQVPIHDNSVCVKKYQEKRRFASENQFGNLVFCAGDLRGGHDNCKGDSGGPMMYSIRNGTRFYQIGIISYGIRCAEPGVPSVYTSVPMFINWIDNVINQDDYYIL